MIGVDDYSTDAKGVDLPLEEKPANLFTPTETPYTRINSTTHYQHFSHFLAYSVTTDYSSGNLTPMSRYDQNGDHSDRGSLLSSVTIENRYKGDSDGI